MPLDVRADLHIHSCLSPCASLDNSPSAIIEEAVKKGLNMVALADHNTGANLPAFFECAKKAGITPIAGMELTALEEVHLLVLLPTLETAMEFSDFLYENMLDFPFDPEKMGDQIIVNEDEEIIGELTKYLGFALPYSLEELVEMTHDRGGLAIAAHVDRFAYSIPSVLGFLPDLPFDAVECYNPPCQIPLKKPLPVITDSDAHYVEEVGKRFNRLSLPSCDFQGLKSFIQTFLEAF